MTLSPIIGLCGPSLASLYHAGAVRHALDAPFAIVWRPGWRPHEIPRKPLKPGSAAQRLADALGTREIPTGEKPRP